MQATCEIWEVREDLWRLHICGRVEEKAEATYLSDLQPSQLVFPLTFLVERWKEGSNRVYVTMAPCDVQSQTGHTITHIVIK